MFREKQHFSGPQGAAGAIAPQAWSRAVLGPAFDDFGVRFGRPGATNRPLVGDFVFDEISSDLPETMFIDVWLILYSISII